jgi:DNA end-binding protein Ku
MDDHVLEWKEVLRGFEISKDQFVIIEDEDLDKLPLPTSHTLEIAEFVNAADIPAELYMKQAYYLEPEKVGVKPYYLLKRALSEAGRVAVGKIAFHDREHMATIRPHGKGIVVNTLHWPDEIRSMDELTLPEDEVKVNDGEMAMAKMLIENLSQEFDPARYRDEYREAVVAMAQAKAEGEEIVAVEAPQPKVMDLMAALKASVEASKKAAADRGAQAAAESEERPHRRVDKAS